MTALILLFLALPGLQVLLYFSPSAGGMPGLFAPPPAEIANYALAVLCYHWMLANVIVAARVPFLQRHLPHDARIRFHMLGAGGIAAALLYHAAFKILDGKRIDAISWALLGLFLLMIALALLWIPLPGFARVRSLLVSSLRRGAEFSYETMKKAHNVLLLSLSALMLLHLYRAEVFDALPWLSTAIFAAYGLGALSVLAWSKLRVPFLPRLDLVAIDSLEDVRVLRFSTSSRLRYKAGQFAFLRISRLGAASESHPFSFLSSPAEGSVAFGVRVLGDFTGGLDTLRPGDQARVDGGYGDFRPREGADERPVCLVSTGMGAVPCVCIAKDHHARRSTRRLSLFVSARRAREVPELEVLEAMAAENPAIRLRLLLRERGDPRYDAAFFRAEIERPQAWDFLVCASPAPRRKIVESLREIGVPRSRIKVESFAFG